MSERRRRKVVAKFQTKLVYRMVMYWGIYQLTLFNVMFCWRLLSEGNGNIVHEYALFIQEFYPMLLCFLVLVPAFAWDAVKFYHRIAGPIYRFRATICEVADEQPVRPVKLRDGDELMEMQDEFNAMLATLERRGGVEIVDPADAAAEQNGPDTEALVADTQPVEEHAHAAS